jgi:hypothetical protein
MSRAPAGLLLCMHAGLGAVVQCCPDIICGQAGNDRVLGGVGNDILIGDGVDVPPFIPSNGQNNDVLLGGPGDDTPAGLGGDDDLLGDPATTSGQGDMSADRSFPMLSRRLTRAAPPVWRCR